MKVALISFEYPPAVAVGGIGTYAWHASHMLAESGVTVEVFAAGPADAVEQPHPRIRVQRVAAAARQPFAAALVPHLLAGHGRQPFDVIEAPEIGPEGAPAFAALPSAARVVKLHTPSYLVNALGYEPPSWAARCRFWAGALRRGQWSTLSRPAYDREQDAEFHGARLADEISAPSRAIGEIVARDWSLDAARVRQLPLPFRPAASFLALPLPERVATLGFLGRLEPRKGVVEMAEAIPAILAQAPHLRFRFIGPAWPYRGTDMRTWIERRLPRVRPALEFAGAVAPSAIPAELARCDVLVLPSRWENFPFACWEALASGRAVIGSAAGGMAEVIEPGVSGLLVPPRAPAAIAASVLSLVRTPARVAAMGAAGRDRVVSLLDPARILPLQLDSYRRAIAHAARRNSGA